MEKQRFNNNMYNKNNNSNRWVTNGCKNWDIIGVGGLEEFKQSHYCRDSSIPKNT